MRACYDDQRQWVSGYRIMWSLVMFDLPTKEKSERKAYARFRNFLLDNGYMRAQYSVYMRVYPGKEAAESFARRLEKNRPKAGAVQMLVITDKQYENMLTFSGGRRKANKNPEQYALF